MPAYGERLANPPGSESEDVQPTKCVAQGRKSVYPGVAIADDAVPSVRSEGKVLPSTVVSPPKGEVKWSAASPGVCLYCSKRIDHPGEHTSQNKTVPVSFHCNLGLLHKCLYCGLTSRYYKLVSLLPPCVGLANTSIGT